MCVLIYLHFNSIIFRLWSLFHIFLCKFVAIEKQIYGAFQLRIYDTSFYFYVMHNIFHNAESEVVNEKYDIKGSWVNRNAAIPMEGQVATCSNCNQKFVFMKPKRAIKSANRAAMREMYVGILKKYNR